jgi:hypothetical protein
MQEEVKLNSGERSVRTCIACMENPYVVQRNYGLPWRPSLFTSLCPDNPQTPPPNRQATDFPTSGPSSSSTSTLAIENNLVRTGANFFLVLSSPNRNARASP